MAQTHHTTGKKATMLACPEWRVRRAADALQGGVPRVGQYRAVPKGLWGKLRQELLKKATRGRTRPRRDSLTHVNDETVGIRNGVH